MLASCKAKLSVYSGFVKLMNCVSGLGNSPCGNYCIAILTTNTAERDRKRARVEDGAEWIGRQRTGKQASQRMMNSQTG